MIRIKFTRKFVLMTTHTERDDEDGLLKTRQLQYHVEPDNKSFAVSDAQHASTNTVVITFAEGGPYKGTAVVEQSYVEIIKDTGPAVAFSGKGCC